MAEPITQAMYSVPITRRVGYYESQIPEEYRGRTHTAKQEHVRCALFPGENMVKVTWGGADEATVIYQCEEQGKAVATQTLGVIPAGGGARSRLFSVPALTAQDYVYVKFATVGREGDTAAGSVTVIGMDAS